VDLKRVNKRTLEGLLRAGAFDGVCGGRGRARLLGAIDRAVELGQGAGRDRESGQRGLFDVLPDAQIETVFVEEYPDIPEWSPKERLVGERDALGFYLTGHPLDRFSQDVERFATTSVGNLRKDHSGSEVVLAGVICDFREVQTRSGKGPMAFFQLEDQLGRIEVVVFPKTYARIDEVSQMSLAEQLERAGDEPVLVTGRVEAELGEAGDVTRFKLLADAVRPMAEVRAERTQGVLLRLTEAQLKQLVSDHSGTCKMELQVTVDDRFSSTLVFGDAFTVAADEALLLALDRLFTPGVARLV
jgi:DNA polymerase-3 subunit alpha